MKTSINNTCYRLLKHCVICLIVVAFQVGFTDLALCQSAELYVGAAYTDITPPVGYAQYRGNSTGIDNPLYAKAIVFQQGEIKAALVICDLIRITSDLSREVRTRVAKETGIEYSNIFLAATHTHTGPVYRFDLAEYMAWVRSVELSPENEKDYPAILIDGVSKSVMEANSALQPTEISTGKAEVHGISFNRRFLLKDGSVRFNAGVGNPDIVRPAGPVDPQFPIILFRNLADGSPTAALSNFALHLDTVGGLQFHADYPFYLSEELKNEFGPSFISVFSAGASGNINHIDVSETPSPNTRFIGESLSNAFKEELPLLEAVSNTVLGVRSETVFAPLQNFTPEEVEWAFSNVDDSIARWNVSHGMGTELAYRYEDDESQLYNERRFLQGIRKRKIQTLYQMREFGEAIAPSVGTLDWTLPLEIQVFRLSEEVAIVAMPGELFVELGLKIKKLSPFENTIVIQMANQNITYVPTREAFRQGDYEVINSRLAPGGGELMVKSALRMLEDLAAELSDD